MGSVCELHRADVAFMNEYHKVTGKMNASPLKTDKYPILQLHYEDVKASITEKLQDHCVCQAIRKVRTNRSTV